MKIETNNMCVLPSQRKQRVLLLFGAAVLLPAATVRGDCVEVTHSGFLVDNKCWANEDHGSPDGSFLDVNPQDHTKMCLLMPPCIESGYGLLEQMADGTYGYKYKLDDTSNALADKMIEDSTMEKDFFVTLQGEQCDEDHIMCAQSDDMDCVPTIRAIQMETCESFKHTGYLVDNACWDAENHASPDGSFLDKNPQDHTKMCLLMPPCVDSGYALLEKAANGAYEYKYRLDDESNEIAVEMIGASSKEKDFEVVVEGYICGDTVSVTTMALTPPDECEPFTHTGYLVDNNCWDAENHASPDGSFLDKNPQDHTKMCLLMPPCVESGYGLLEKAADGTYEYKYRLDKESNEIAVETIGASSKEKDFEVVVEGEICGDTVSLTTMALASDEPSPGSDRKAGKTLAWLAAVFAALPFMM